MPRVELLQIYKFPELSEASKKVAREWFKESVECSDSIHEMYIRDLYEAGYPTTDINFSLGYSQGDGMAFYTGGRYPKRKYHPWVHVEETKITSAVDLRRLWVRRLAQSFSRPKRLELYDAYLKYVVTGDLDLTIEINRNDFGRHYSHWNTMRVSIDSRWCGDQDEAERAVGDALVNELEEAIQDDVRNLSKELEKAGYEEIDYQTSDATIDDILGDGHYEFTEDGKAH